MPTSFLSADAGFPRLTADIPQEERLNRIENYLYMLLEQLRYTLYNLGKDNFNEAELKQIEEETGGPLYKIITDLEGNVATLEATASSLSATVSDLAGDVGSVTLTATELTTRLNNFNGSSSTIEQTATAITTRLNNFDGSGSTIEQTAEALNFAVFNPSGALSLVSQKADRIDWIVASGTSASTMTLTSEMASLIADEISITGTVTFHDLETAGSSVINGDNVELKADADGDSVSYLTYKSAADSIFAQVHTRDNRTASTLDRDRYAFVIETPERVDGSYCALKLEAGDSMSLEAGYQIYIKADTQTVINSGALPTRIQGTVAYDPTWSYIYAPTDCYLFCSDGIYYNGTKIVST